MTHAQTLRGNPIELWVEPWIQSRFQQCVLRITSRLRNNSEMRLFHAVHDIRIPREKGHSNETKVLRVGESLMEWRAITLVLVYMNSEKEWGLTILIELLIINDQQNKWDGEESFPPPVGWSKDGLRDSASSPVVGILNTNFLKARTWKSDCNALFM